MDARHFDDLVSRLRIPTSRRRLLALAAAPVLGGLLGLLEPEDAGAKERRRRRKQRHKKRKHPGHRKKGCRPKSRATVCAWHCGAIRNRQTCGKTIDCGSCTCEAGSCVNPTPVCSNGQCVACSDLRPCPNGCCDASGSCQPGNTTTACGDIGQACATCVVSGEVCSAGDCDCSSQVICSASGCCASASDVCDADDECCTPIDPCTGSACGVVTDNCGQSITCDPCPPLITSFTATPETIDRAATPPETALLSWTTSDATTCTLDDGNGPVTVNCTDSLSVGPSATATYTLSASGPGGGPVTDEATVTVEYCHSVTAPGRTCPTGETQVCLSQPITASSADDARAACEACYGVGECFNDVSCVAGGATSAWRGQTSSGPGAFNYLGARAGDIVSVAGADFCQSVGVRWAP